MSAPGRRRGRAGRRSPAPRRYSSTRPKSRPATTARRAAEEHEPARPGRRSAAAPPCPAGGDRDRRGWPRRGRRRADAAELRLGRDEQAVGEHRLGQGLDVVGHDVGPAGGGGPGAARPQQGERRPGRHRQGERGWRRVASATSTRYALRLGATCTARHRLLDGDDVGGCRRPGSTVVEGVVVAVGVEHRQLGRLVGVADRDAHQEAVELALRQRVGALVLDRVLGGHDEERRRRAW